MTATDELRRLLDERGVEYRAIGDATFWETHDGAFRYKAKSNAEKLMVMTCCSQKCTVMTPAQAIDTTLGAGTCKQEERGWSTEGDHARVWLTCGHDCMVETVADLPNFCPICGAKVVCE